VFRADGTYAFEWGSFGTGPGQFNHPACVAIDGAGNVFVMDKDNSRVQKFAPVPTAAGRASWGAVKVLYR
jgi:DNA-binding beta-propeller fold protein YncE